MPSALSLLSLVTGVASSLVSLVTSVVSSVTSLVSAIVSAGHTIVTALVSIGSSIVSVISATITAGAALGHAFMSVVSSIAAGVAAIGAVIGPIISGVIASITAASSVASAIVGAISSGIGTISSVVGSVVSTFSSVFATIGPIISSVAGALSTAFSAVMGVVGPFVSAIAGAISGIVGAVTSIVGALTSVVQAVTSSFQSISQALGGILSAAGSAVSALASAIQSCVSSLMSFAHDVAGIRAQTGMGLATATDLTYDFQSVGVSSGDTAKIFGDREMNPALLNQRLQSMGAPTTQSPDFIPKLAEWFQTRSNNGTYGYLGARSEMDAAFGGQTPEPLLRLINMDPQKLRESQQYGREVRSDMGVGPGVIKAASEDLPLLINRISTFVDAVKMRFAADLMPALEAAFSVASNLLKDNAGSISGLLETATRAIFVDGPDLAANAATTALDWGSALADMFFNVADAGLSLLETFGNRDGVLYGILMTGARFVDFMVNVANQIAGGIAFMQAAFENNIHMFIRGIISTIMGPLAMIPGAVDKAKELFAGFTGFEFEAKSPVKAFQDAVDNGSKFSAQDTVNGWADKASQIDINGFRSSLTKRRKDTQAAFDAGHQQVDRFHAQFKSTDERKRIYDERLLQANERSVAVQENHLAVSKQQLDATKNTQSGGSAGQIIARMSAYLAQDAYRLTAR
ncbi:hypothetical protein IAD21_00691 [Abditibacteriota bacterium]|nr:hypothetical protein IAD21_00691 [Abditibacteriota bacterium]